MDQISVSEGVGLAGLLAILAKSYLPALKTFLVNLVSKATGSSEADDVVAVIAYETLADRLSPETAKTVWAEIQPRTEEAKP